MLETYEAPLQLCEYPLPSHLDPGAVLVRTKMAGVCGTDVHLWKGKLPISLPIIMGHDQGFSPQQKQPVGTVIDQVGSHLAIFGTRGSMNLTIGLL